jgi:hypothetical protein
MDSEVSPVSCSVAIVLLIRLEQPFKIFVRVHSNDALNMRRILRVQVIPILKESLFNWRRYKH